MKRKIIAFFVIMMTIFVGSRAYAAWVHYGSTFSAVSPSGHTLYYTQTNGGSLWVHYYQSYEYNDAYSDPYISISGGQHPTGNLIIPDSVNGYPVIGISTWGFRNSTGLSSVSLPNTIRYILHSAFKGCSGLEHINIPEGVTYIDSMVFQECSLLDSIIIPNTVTNIRKRAFYGCYNLSNIVFSNSLQTIGEWAFYSCYSLPVTNIPSSITTIGSYAFHYVKMIYYSGTATGAPWGALCVNGYQKDSLYYTNSSKTILVGAHPKIHSVVIPNTVTIIKDYAFHYCKNIDTLTIPSSVIAIGRSFAYCTNLHTLNFLSENCSFQSNYWGGVVSCFQGDTNLVTINIGNTVSRIPEDFFKGCDKVETIFIPNSVSYIGSGAFLNCNGLTSTNYNGTISEWMNITFGDTASNPVLYSHNLYINGNLLNYLDIPDSITEIKAFSFAGCNSIIGPLNIGTQIQSIGNSAFKNCSQISSINFNANNYYTNASNNAESAPFKGCTGITSIIIGSDVTRIANYTLYGCNNVTEVYVNREAPPYIYQNTFGGVPQYIPVYVPCGSMQTYYNNYNWSYFTNIDENCETVTIIANSSNDAMGAVSGGGTYPIGDTVQLTAIPYAGYSFTNWSNGDVTNPLSVVADGNISMTAVFITTPNYVLVHDTTYFDVHDTTYVDVLYPVHDTTIVHDTTYVDVPYPVHDTTIVHDTTYVDVPYPVHDTTIVHDTTYVDVPYPVHDTTIVHDTTYVDVPYPVHDTIIVHDTTFVDVPYHVHDTTIVTMTDTISIHDTTTVFQTDTLWLHDTVYLHDTIFIHDTIVVGVDEVDAINAKIYTNNGHIVVDGAESNTVWLYDVNGRILAIKHDEYSPLRFDVPVSGAYLVKIGNYPARKVVVIR